MEQEATQLVCGYPRGVMVYAHSEMADLLGFAGNLLGGVFGCAGTILVFWKQLKREDATSVRNRTEPGAENCGNQPNNFTRTSGR